MSRCEKCNKESDYLHAVYVCSACMSEVGVSQSRSSGGSSAAGTGQRAHSSDGCNLSGKNLTLKKVTSFDGKGWYLEYLNGGYYVYIILNCWHYNQVISGEAWKIPE